jgi:hypothetical protein
VANAYDKNQFFKGQPSFLAAVELNNFVQQNQMKMASTIYHHIPAQYTEKTSSPSLISKFIHWCEGQQENRLLWLGIALAGHGCILTPLTVMAVLLAGTNLTLFMLALVAMAISLVTNLAALPTRITIPALAFTVLMDIAIVIYCASTGFNIANTYI